MNFRVWVLRELERERERTLKVEAKKNTVWLCVWRVTKGLIFSGEKRTDENAMKLVYIYTYKENAGVKRVLRGEEKKGENKAP